MVDNPETIVALSTPPGRSALAIVRVSGPEAFAVIGGMISEQEPPKARFAALRHLKRRDGELLDESLVLFFPGPGSYTGEDLVEIHCHGNPLIYEAILSDIVSRGTRLARPGEFSLRAALNQKLSLHELEGLDLILNGQSEAVVRMGLRAKMGDFSQRAHELKEKILNLSAEFEARLDFLEEDLDESLKNKIRAELLGLEKALSEWLASYQRSRRFIARQSACLVGRPNVGKSSLFNALIGEKRALVHELAGTTRDYLEVELRLGERYILLFDTAGLREAQDPIEQMGIEKSKEAITRSDTVIWVSETGEEPPDALMAGLGDRRLIKVLSKSEGEKRAPQGFLAVSAKEGVGLEALRGAILGPKEDSIEELSYILSDREAKVLERAIQISATMRAGVDSEEPLELGAEKLRALAAQLEDLIGKKAHADVLKRILGRFCIGK